MTRMSWLTGVCLAVAGCSPNLEASNERGGILPHVIGLNRAEAFSAADQHCRKFGRVARFSGTDALNSTLSFDCVAP